ncbi:Na+/H+ antiporter subunit C [Microvenator marinus]|uniref:Na+/H+ antiporter subunit C n=1 Tax=Microvenator marinus TaxID=2600177 RepID=A0A5B8Y1L9_9DELT|nr:Na+/H+ antiporter subunit C [Microvenator marinus]
MLSLEFLVASAIGVLVASGLYLMLRGRTFPVIIGLTLLSYAVNLFLFGMGRLVIGAPPIIQDGVATYSDPIPQALVLTAIVIGFGMTAYAITLAVKAYVVLGTDQIDGKEGA